MSLHHFLDSYPVRKYDLPPPQAETESTLRNDLEPASFLAIFPASFAFARQNPDRNFLRFPLSPIKSGCGLQRGTYVFTDHLNTRKLTPKLPKIRCRCKCLKPNKSRATNPSRLIHTMRYRRKIPVLHILEYKSEADVT